MNRSARRSAASHRGRSSAFDALTTRAMVAAQEERPAEAIDLFRRCVDIECSERSLCNLAKALKSSGHIEHACAIYRQAVALAPTSFQATVGLAECLHETSNFNEAQAACAKALTLYAPMRDTSLANAEAAGPYVLMGRICYDRLDFSSAVAAFRKAVEYDPLNVRAFGNLGLALHELGLLQDAFNALHQAVTLQPDYVIGYNNLAGLLIAMGQLDMAANCSKIAIALAPDTAELYLNYAVALRLNKDLVGAIDAFRSAVERDPDRPDVMLELHHLQQQTCNWTGLAAHQRGALRDALDRGKRIPPFVVLTGPSNRDQQLASARLWAAGLSTSGVAPLATQAWDREGPARRVRIGYLSADFHSHATAALIAEVLERHDKGRFETFGYSIGPDDGSPLRTRLMHGFDHFIDLKDVTSFEVAARRIHADRIDVLLDLKGYTQNARSEILAFRPAPVQVNYLGFPGTMGSAMIDYVIGDAYVTPAAHAEDFTESIVHLPDCYQPNDRQRAVAPAAPTRMECGLPAEGFVFCSFNNTYKITPEVFDVWMRLLRETPGSVLWLLTSNDLVAANLRREAASREVAEERLVFAPFVASDAHIARMARADLFLDTVPVNAHTTASEALWVGLPVLTCLGKTFAGRVAASLLHAVGLPELVADDLSAYEALAFRLVNQPELLDALRRRLVANRLTAPLFDTTRYVAHYEAALTAMVERREAGLPPQAFAVDATGGPARLLDGRSHDRALAP